MLLNKLNWGRLQQKRAKIALVGSYTESFDRWRAYADLRNRVSD
jgi:hypothetical protein